MLYLLQHHLIVLSVKMGQAVNMSNIHLFYVIVLKVTLEKDVVSKWFKSFFIIIQDFDSENSYTLQK